MKKIKLLVVCMCLGIIGVFGTNKISYNVSNKIYTESNTNLIGKEVKVKGIDTSFHIISVDGNKVRLLYNDMTRNRYYYNSSSDGDKPVAFEKSQAYQTLIDNYSYFKSNIENTRGDTSIFKLDIPMIEEFYDLGYLARDVSSNGNYDYSVKETTPNWLFQTTTSDTVSWITKSVTADNKCLYNIYSYYYHYYLSNGELASGYTKKIGSTSFYNPLSVTTYGYSIRPVLETSVLNLTSSDADVMAYVNRFVNNNSSNKTNTNNNQNNTQVVKVPSTSANSTIIFTAIGLAIIIIAGITIFILVRNRKGKN